MDRLRAEPLLQLGQSYDAQVPLQPLTRSPTLAEDFFGVGVAFTQHGWPWQSAFEASPAGAADKSLYAERRAGRKGPLPLYKYVFVS